MINRFLGKYRFLSNFYGAPITFKGRRFQTVEHAYQAAKTINIADIEAIQNASSAGHAKKLGKKVKLVADWETLRPNVMRQLLISKFLGYPELKQKLLDTNDLTIIEGNRWHDTYWGYCECGHCPPGKNMLGKLLMQIRAELRVADLSK